MGNFFSDEFKTLHADLDKLGDSIAKAEHDSVCAKDLNSLAINALVNAARPRPHPFTTLSDYTSWDSLTDRTYSARGLPAYYPPKPLPDPDDLIKLFDRPTGHQALSNKSTCLFPSFAQYLTDGFIRTTMPHSKDDQTARRRNTSNHEIDMCPLYGRLDKYTAILRLNSQLAGRRGRLKSQFIGDEEFPPFLFEEDGLKIKPEFLGLEPPLRLNDLDDDPNGAQKRAHLFATGGDRTNTAPQVSMMNTLWLREHNRLAGVIEKAHPDFDDERVFQTARNTVIVEFIKIVVEDYINHISPSPIKMIADPSVAWGAKWNKPNWITTEFSLLYRWHSLIPDTIDWNGVNVPVAGTLMNNELLIQAPLAEAFVKLSAQPAGRLGALNTATALLPIEKNSILQGRICNVAPYNQYRTKYLINGKAATFESISSNEVVREILRSAYGDIDSVEFYTGIFAEDVGVNTPLPPTIMSMVAVDAFSQALTNPLLSEFVFNPDTFSKEGWDAIQNTSTLRQVVDRNCAGLGDRLVTMTQPDWKFDWVALCEALI